MLLWRVEAPLPGTRQGRVGRGGALASSPTFTRGPPCPCLRGLWMALASRRARRSWRGGVLQERGPFLPPMAGQGSFPGSPGVQDQKQAGSCPQTLSRGGHSCTEHAREEGSLEVQGSQRQPCSQERLLGKSWASTILCKLTDCPDQRCRRMSQVTGL